MRVVATILATLLALAAVSCTSTPPIVIQPTPVPTREPNTLAVTVLLDLSGSRAPSGQAQRNAMQLWLDSAQSATPLRLKVKFVDVAGSDARVLIALRRAAVEDHADAIVVGTPTMVDESFTRAAQVAGVPVLLTLPAPEPTGMPGGRWVFGLAPLPEEIADLLVDDIDARHLRTPSLLVSDETPSAVAQRIAFAAAMGERDHPAPAPLLVTTGDAAQKMRGPLAVARSVILAGASGRYVDAIRSIAVSSGAPRVYLPYLTETADLTAVRDQATLLTWPGSRFLATLSVPPFPGPRATFVRAYTDRHGAPSTLAATAYDALALIDAAAELAPSELDAANLRLRIETLTFPGVATRYTFTPARHAGFTTGDLAYLRWNAERGAPFLAADTTGTAK